MIYYLFISSCNYIKRETGVKLMALNEEAKRLTMRGYKIVNIAVGRKIEVLL
jgi:hypothetical protein